MLVRAIVADDQDQARRAVHAIATRCTVERPGYITHVVLCELTWTLRRHYKYSRAVIIDALTRLSHQETLLIEAPDLVDRALELYRSRGVDFADALIVVTHAAAGCTTTLTFDRTAAGRLPGFEAV